ncbi:hypothetical protein MKW94_017520 [Papaver nudicaule]|uniref:Uncharacterized protein n=1 Tax=Papaver nudicaule TaxID=74823 RepID=A0AA41V9G1_PAPNU|nr:hypothetical protein [Papaver nudicaule]
MAQRALNHHRQTLESFTYQLHTWKPFQFQTLTKPLSDSHKLSDRATTATSTAPIDTLDMSKLSIIEDEKRPKKKEKLFQWFSSAKKRRRHGSRSVSGRSTSDRSGTRRCCSVGASAAHATCSDFVVAATNTDSSGELFVNAGGGGGGGGEGNWSSDVSEVKNSRMDKKDCGGGGGSGAGERGESLTSGGVWQIGGFDNQGNESGYGSEPGYRGDAEFGYGDEFDEEEDDGRVFFWGERSRDTDSNMEMVEENTFSDQKYHYRCRRKKHDWRMAVDPPR